MRSKTQGLVFALFGLLLAAVPVLAHHSVTAEFDPKKSFTVTGTLKKLDWTNPHAWLYLEVTAAGGPPVQWAIELSAPNALARRGLRPDTMRPGAALVVKGYRAKNGAPVARGWLVKLPDGRELDLTNRE